MNNTAKLLLRFVRPVCLVLLGISFGVAIAVTPLYILGPPGVENNFSSGLGMAKSTILLGIVFCGLVEAAIWLLKDFLETLEVEGWHELDNKVAWVKRGLNVLPWVYLLVTVLYLLRLGYSLRLITGGG